MFLYIDPGTGSMLFSLFIGIAASAVFLFRSLIIKLKFVFSGGKTVARGDKVAPYVIFSDSKRYWNVFEPICDEFERRQIPVLFFTASPDDPALSREYKFVTAEFIGEGNAAFARLNMLRADICLSTTPGLDVFQWKRSKECRCYVHIPHSLDDLSVYRMFGIDFYDSILISGSCQEKRVREMERLRNLPSKELIYAGSTYMDSLKSRFEKLETKTKNSRPVVLVAPSWGPSGILTRFGEKLISALAANDFDVVVRPHPQTVVSEKEILASLQTTFKSNEKVSWNFDNDNFEILNRADILISDFSGVIFDFAFIFNKPVIYADVAFDAGPYDADWFDEPMWTLRVLPEIGVQLKEEDFPRIGEIVNEALESQKLSENRDKARNEVWTCIGEGAKNTVDYLVKKHTSDAQ